jgi:hypothetical protein
MIKRLTRLTILLCALILLLTSQAAAALSTTINNPTSNYINRAGWGNGISITVHSWSDANVWDVNLIEAKITRTSTAADLPYTGAYTYSEGYYLNDGSWQEGYLDNWRMSVHWVQYGTHIWDVVDPDGSTAHFLVNGAQYNVATRFMGHTFGNAEIYLTGPSLSFTYDNIIPSVDYGQTPTPINTPPILEGTAEDEHTGIEEVYGVLYRYDNGIPQYWAGVSWSPAMAFEVPVTNLTGGSTPNGTADWSRECPPLISGKRYYYRFYSYDKAGNKSPSDGTYSFLYDADDPDVTLTKPDQAPDNSCTYTVAGPNVTAKFNSISWDKKIRGDVSDSGGAGIASGVASVELSIIKNGTESFNGVTWQPNLDGKVTATVFGGGQQKHFSYLLPTIFFNTVSNNDLITVKAIAHDQAGNDDETIVNSFRIDLDPPTTSVGNPTTFCVVPSEIYGTTTDNISGSELVLLEVTRTFNGQTKYLGYVSLWDWTFIWYDTPHFVFADLSPPSGPTRDWSIPANFVFSGIQPNDIVSVTAWAKDFAGNEEVAGAPTQLTYDTSGPLLGIDRPSSNYLNSLNELDQIEINASHPSGILSVEFAAYVDNSEVFNWVTETWVPIASSPPAQEIWQDITGYGNGNTYTFPLPQAFRNRLENGSSLQFAVGAEAVNLMPSTLNSLFIIDTGDPSNPTPTSVYTSSLHNGVRWQNDPVGRISIYNPNDKVGDLEAGEDPIPAGLVASGLQGYITFIQDPSGSTITQTISPPTGPIDWNRQGEEGVYKVKFRSIDNAGNSASDGNGSPVPVVLLEGYDATQPHDFNVSHSPSNGLTTDTVTPTLSFATTDDRSGIKEYEIIHDGNLLGTTTANSYQIPVGHLANGSNTVSVLAYDHAGNYKVSDHTFTVYTFIPPVLEIFSPENGAAVNSTELQIVGRAIDESRVALVEISVNGGSFTTVFSGLSCVADFIHPVNNLIPGATSTIVISATDDTNKTTQTTITVLCDLDPPTAPVITYPEDNGWTTDWPDFTWDESTDALSGIKSYDVYIDDIMINPEPIPGNSYAVTSALSDGAHSIRVVAWDRAGNSTPSATYNFEVDSIEPDTFTLLAPADGDYTEEPFEVMWTESSDADSGLAVYEVYCDDEKISETEASNTSLLITEVPDDGSHIISVKARDVAGNFTPSSNTANIITNPNPPVITLYVNDKLIADGDRISYAPRIRAQISDKSGIDPASIKMTIDGQVQESYSLQTTQAQASSQVTAYAVNLNNQRLAPGKHSIEFEARDSHGKKATLKVENLDVSDTVAVEGQTFTYPNPFGPGDGLTLKIAYTLDNDADINIYIYDLTGRLVQKIFCPAGTQGGWVGENDVPWDGKDAFGTILGNGAYIYTVTANKVLAFGGFAIHE